MSGQPVRALERRIGVVLEVGTWVASAVVAIGLGASLALPSGARLVTSGIALFIALPVLRVVLMLIEYVRRRDLRIGVVTALVLAVIVLAIALSVRTNAIGG
jgi:uncharacterized membrane protein